MSFAWGEEEALGCDSAERRQVDGIRVFDTVAVASACGDQRIRESQSSDVN
jgi:hypothetical protein